MNKKSLEESHKYRKDKADKVTRESKSIFQKQSNNKLSEYLEIPKIYHPWITGVSNKNVTKLFIICNKVKKLNIMSYFISNF